MRLTAGEVDAIKAAVADIFGTNAVVRLFGSRVDDARRGGDIDLHITLATPASGDANGRFLLALMRTIGEREIDVIYSYVGAPPRPVDNSAFSRGIVL
ncbi:MAG: hypothetical protein JWO15_1328 [Sphingomonadales bacterium]|nr:hypothetical protein [Sphingomonadales bacterium]